METDERTGAIPVLVSGWKSTTENRISVIKNNPAIKHCLTENTTMPPFVSSCLHNISHGRQTPRRTEDNPHDDVCCCRDKILRKALRLSIRRVQSRICPYISRMHNKVPYFLQEDQCNFRKLTSHSFDSSCNGRCSEGVLTVQEMIGRSLEKHGVCVLNRFMGTDASSEIANEVASLHDHRVWNKGRSIGSNASVKCPRQDMITWLNGKEAQYPFIRKLCAKLDEVVASGQGVADGYSICGSTKMMVAKYSGNGSHYHLHVDNPSKDGRCLTCIYYVNKDWDSSTMGGNLRIEAKTSGKTARVEPIIDRVVFFYSDARNPHEVLPAYKDRFAITLWYFDYGERAKAIGRIINPCSNE